MGAQQAEMLLEREKPWVLTDGVDPSLLLSKYEILYRQEVMNLEKRNRELEEENISLRLRYRLRSR